MESVGIYNISKRDINIVHFKEYRINLLSGMLTRFRMTIAQTNKKKFCKSQITKAVKTILIIL